jgi:hypothetical protein
MKPSSAILQILLLIKIISNFNLISDSKKSLSTLTMKQKELTNNQWLLSQDSVYFAKMQSDGNFVVYSAKGRNGRAEDHPIWASNTNGKGTGPYRLAMQDDGNLVVYDSSGKPTWASNTDKKGTGPYRLVMQKDGNLVLYDSKNSPTWATGTDGKKF